MAGPLTADIPQARFSDVVVVKSVLSVLPSGAAIFGVLLESGRSLRVKANAETLSSIPRVGDALRLEAIYQQSLTYGLQLIALSSRPAMPRGHLLVEYLATSPHFKGIGKVKAQRLVSEYGDKLTALLNAGRGSSLRRVLNAQAAESLIAAWGKCKAEASAMEFFGEFGIELSAVRMIMKAWGTDAKRVLDVNPYILLACVKWEVVDRVALRIGFDARDSRRLVGCVESCLYDQLGQGHTVVSADLLRSKFGKRLPPALFERAIRLCIEQHSVVALAGLGYQAISVHAMEQFVRTTILARVGRVKITDHGCADNGDLRLRRSEGENNNLPLSAEQQRAVCLLRDSKVGLLVGPAGSGKTTVLDALCSLFEDAGRTMVLVAVAARAARKMQEATGRPATTIAALLKHVRTGRSKIVANDVVVVDEASMLDLPTMFAICRELPPEANIFLVGDDHQLPPIGFGLVLKPLMSSSRIPVARLSEVRRHGPESDVCKLANRLRTGEADSLPSFNDQTIGASLMLCHSISIQKALAEVCKSGFDKWVILTPTRSGPAGAAAINMFLHENNPGKRLDGMQFAEGDPVMHIVNDYEGELLNGTMGKIIKVENNPRAKGLHVAFDGCVVFFCLADIVGRLELGYAISVHKSQGSEFERVAVMGFKGHRFDRAMLYTAVTRARSQVVIFGEEDCLKAALNRENPATLRKIALKL